MNTFKGVRSALEYEVSRQIEAINSGESIPQETRLWDAEKGVTTSMRTKEEAHDYRYFPEPDLVPFVKNDSLASEIKMTIGELPDEKAKRFKGEFALSDKTIGVLISDKETADYLEECVKLYKNPKIVANWITGELMAQANLKNGTIVELGISASDLVGLLKMIDDGTISGKMAKGILIEAIETRHKPQDIVESKGLKQITDNAMLDEVVRAILKKNEKSVKDYKSGKKNALTYLVGQIMKETKGKANPALVNEILRQNLGE